MLIIDGNAVYEIDCECLSSKQGSPSLTVRCNDKLLEKDEVAIDTGDVCVEREEYTGKGVTVAVLDTGIFPHPDFAGRIKGWYDAVTHRPEPFDQNGHGTQEEGNKNKP